jgi:hypothetical protein
VKDISLCKEFGVMVEKNFDENEDEKVKRRTREAAGKDVLYVVAIYMSL